MAALSGQTAVTTAGTEVALGSGRANAPVAIKALSTNTGKMYIGNAGDNTVSSSTGYSLSAGDQIIMAYLGDLADVMVDSSVDGEKVCWLILGSM